MQTKQSWQLDASYFTVIDSDTGQFYYGCDQQWYTTEWQRCAGCGPSTAAALIFFYQQKQGAQINHEKQSVLKLMKEVWNYVTPTEQGVNSTTMFQKGINAYAQTHHLLLDYHILDIAENPTERPRDYEVIEFISQGLQTPSPVAFLNLCNGKEHNLDRWHWVLITKLEVDENHKTAVITICDEGKMKEIDLKLWLKTTTLGGGFCYFT